LEILVYCKPAKCIKIEQKFINLLKPSYNLLQIAGSRLGSIVSGETRPKLSVSKKGENNPMFGKTPSEESIAKNMASRASPPNSIKIEVLDLETNVTTTYPTISAAARALNLQRASICTYFASNQTNPFKKRFLFKKISKYSDPSSKPAF
jgi:hypothetical protein